MFVRPGHVAHQHATGIADRVRLDVFVTARDAVDGVYVHAALVRKGGLAHPGLPRVMAHVRNFIHELGKFLEFGQATCAGTPVFFILKCNNGMTLIKLQLPVRSP